MAKASMSLQDVKAQLADLRDLLEKEFRSSPALEFVKQKLQEATTGLEQEARNVRIDAEMEAKRAAGIIK